jgi:type I restriction enzyme, S subunit
VDALARRVEEARGLRSAAVEEAEILFYSAARRLREDLKSKTPTKQIGDITTVTSGGTPDRSNSEYWDGGTIPWIKTGELYDKPIFDSEEKITEKAIQNSSARLFPIDTVLIALYGQGQTRGRTGLLKIPATTNQGSAAIFPQPQIFESRYLQYWLQSLYHEMREENHGGAQPNWNGGMIKQIAIALPPLADQDRVIAYLDGLQAKVDELRCLQVATQKELDALMPSILAKAFAGEL